MDQVKKFYLSSFLKNQTYFTPVMVLFLQFYNLDYTEIFWVYTIAAIANVALEIPTGIMADLIGKRTTIIFSRAFYVAAYLIYGFSGSFVPFVIAQLFITLGDSFRSGTDVAYIFDYLKQKAPNVRYSEVKGKQKFWARIGEAIATGIGGLIAASISYNAVFIFAAIPAIMHFFLVMTFEKIKEQQNTTRLWKRSKSVVSMSFAEIKSSWPLMKLIINIALFVTVTQGAVKFIQPYMQDAGVPLGWFGIIYASTFAATALAVRYSYLLENRFSGAFIVNSLTFIPIISLAILGSGFVHMIGVALFFLILIAENARSPIDNNEFQERISSSNRATLGSILMMARNASLAIFLPLFGWLADAYSFYPVLIIMAAMMAINLLMFHIKPTKNINKTDHI